MATEAVANAANGTTPVSPPNTASASPDVAAEVASLRKIVEDLRKENASARVKNKEIRETSEAEKNALLAEQGKFKELWESAQAKAKEHEQTAAALTPYKERLEKFEARVTKEAETEFAALPENMRPLVPEGLAPEDRLAQIRRVASLAPGAAPRAKPISAASPSVTNSAPGVPTDAAGLREYLRSASQEDRAKVLADAMSRPLRG